MTSFYLQTCKFTTSMNYLYPVNSISWKFELINKIFLQILFTIKKHNIRIVKIISCKIHSFRNFDLFFFLRYHTYFYFIVRCYLLRRTQWVAFSTVKIIYYYKLLIKMIWSMKNDLMIYMLVLIFYEFEILLIRIFHSDCRWIFIE